MSVPVVKAPASPNMSTIKFEAGIPVGVDGKKMKGHDSSRR